MKKWLRIVYKLDESKNDISFWKTQKYYVQMIVEKIDLVNLFADITNKYHIRIANAGGWSDLNTRNSIILKFKEAEKHGLIPVLLYYGDIDPSGIFIIKNIKNNLNSLHKSTNWKCDNLIVEKVGLTDEFVSKHKLTWIDNLITGSKKNLADPSHPDHNKPYVQDYIKKYGKRKCEANAVLPLGDEAIEDLEKYFKKYITLDEKQNKKYFEELKKVQEDVYNLMEQINFKERISGLMKDLKNLNLGETIQSIEEKKEFLISISSIGTEIRKEAKRCSKCKQLIELERFQEHKCSKNMIEPKTEIENEEDNEKPFKNEILVSKQEREEIDNFYKNAVNTCWNELIELVDNNFRDEQNNIDYAKIKLILYENNLEVETTNLIFELKKLI